MIDFLKYYDYDFSSEIRKKPTFYKDQDGKLRTNPPDKHLDYVEWATVLVALYKLGAKSVTFCSEIKDTKPNTIHVVVVIDGLPFSIDYPIIRGDRIVAQPTGLDIHTAELRGFVKCVAIHTGLGLSLWQKEESYLDSFDSRSERQNAVAKQKTLQAKIIGIKTLGELKEFWSTNEDELKDNPNAMKLLTDRKMNLMAHKPTDQQ